MAKLIDAKGKNCPIPVIMAKEAISAGENAFTIEVDNHTAVENLKRLADSQGFQAALRETGGVFSLDFIRLGEACPACETLLTTPQCPAGRGYAVFVGRDIIGSGDRELGSNLMRMFFYTLANSDQPPRHVLFMNAGVKLPALDDQVAEHLNALIAKGTEVLVCGTCLNFYAIADKLQTGTVSNMFDIVSAMQDADKVITV